MRNIDIDIPAGVSRISSADFRALVQAKEHAQGVEPKSKSNGTRHANRYSNQVVKSLPASSAVTLSDQLKALQPLPTEHDEQVQLVQWLRYQQIRHFSIPNGGHRYKSVAVMLADEGVVAGPSDLVILPEVGSALPLVFLEMKRVKKGKVSDSQKEFLSHISALETDGYNVCSRVAYGCADAVKILREIGYGATA